MGSFGGAGAAGCEGDARRVACPCWSVVRVQLDIGVHCFAEVVARVQDGEERTAIHATEDEEERSVYE